MRFSFILLILFFAPWGHCLVKLVKFYGTITYTEKDEARGYPTIAPGEAVNWCMIQNCIAVSKCNATACYIHYANRDSKLTLNDPESGDESFVLIKTWLPDDVSIEYCPNDYIDIDYKFPYESNEMWSWRKVSGVWKFEECKSTWKRFERADGKIICLLASPVKIGASKDEARAKCSEFGAKLMGVASVDESLSMMNSGSKLAPSDSDGFYWLSGERAGPCTSTSTWAYKRNMGWQDGITDTIRDALTEENAEMNCRTDDGKDKSCFAIMNKVGDRVKSITDVPCDESNQIMYGAICGYELYK